MTQDSKKVNAGIHNNLICKFNYESTHAATKNSELNMYVKIKVVLTILMLLAVLLM